MLTFPDLSRLTFPAGFLGAGALMHSWGPRVCPSPEPRMVHIMAGPRVCPSPAATLTSNTGPKVASVALYQAVQVGEPGYLQVGANIVANVIHCPGMQGPLLTGRAPGTEPVVVS